MSESLPDSLAGRYQLERELGRGGFGRVLLVRDRDLERPVALKLLALDARDPEVRARFEREARVTGGLRHPGVVEVYDYGITSEGQPFIAYAFVEGRSLGDVGAGQVDGARLRTWAIEIGEALEALHRSQLVHRDVKPDNVLVAGDGRPVLCDLGIVRSLSDEAHTVVTAEGLILGTPAFMAPELWRGEPASPASDQWAWAATLVQVWRGRGVYRSSGPGEILRDLETWAPDLTDVAAADPDLASVLVRALHRDPKARFASMSEAVAAVRGAGKGGGRLRATEVRAVAEGEAQADRVLPGAPGSRGRGVPVGIALVVIALGLGLGGSNLGGEPPGPAVKAEPVEAEAPVPVEQRPEVLALARASRRLQEIVGTDSARPEDWGAYARKRPHEQWWELVGDSRLSGRVGDLLAALESALPVVEGDRGDAAWLVSRLAGLQELLKDFDRHIDLGRGGSKLGEYLALNPLKNSARVTAEGHWNGLRALIESFLKDQERAEEGRMATAWMSPRLSASVRLAQAAGTEDLRAWVIRVLRAGVRGALPLRADGEIVHVVARVLRGEDIRSRITCAERGQQTDDFQEWVRLARDQVGNSERIRFWARAVEVELQLDRHCPEGIEDGRRGERLRALARWGEHELAVPPQDRRTEVSGDLERVGTMLARWRPADVEDPEAIRERLGEARERLRWRVGKRPRSAEERREMYLEMRQTAVDLADRISPDGPGNHWVRIQNFTGMGRAWMAMGDPEVRPHLLRLLRRFEAWVEVREPRTDQDLRQLLRRMTQLGGLVRTFYRSVNLAGPGLGVLGEAAQARLTAEDMIRATAWVRALDQELGASMVERIRAHPVEPRPLSRLWGLTLAMHTEGDGLDAWVKWTVQAGRENPKELVLETYELTQAVYALRDFDLLGGVSCVSRRELVPEVEAWVAEARGRAGSEPLPGLTLGLLRMEHALADLCGEGVLLPETLGRLRVLSRYLEEDQAREHASSEGRTFERAKQLLEKFEKWSALREGEPELARALVGGLEELAGMAGGGP